MPRDTAPPAPIVRKFPMSMLIGLLSLAADEPTRNVTVHEVPRMLHSNSERRLTLPSARRTSSAESSHHTATAAHRAQPLEKLTRLHPRPVQYTIDSPVADIQWVGKDKMVRHAPVIPRPSNSSLHASSPPPADALCALEQELRVP